MKTARRIVLIILSALCSIPLYAQTYQVYGTVKSATTKSAIEGVHIKLLNNSDSVICLLATDLNGKFIFNNLSKGSYKLDISCMGYESQHINIVNLNSNHNLETLFLAETGIALEEVVVMSANNIQKLDRWILYPTESIKRQSMDAFDVLNRMQLPNLTFDISNRTFSSQKNGQLQIRINGVLSRNSDLIAIQPQDIARIEYIDNPGIEYGDGVTSVILIYTKRGIKGVQAGIQASAAFSTQSNKAYTYTKLSGLNDFFTFKLNGAQMNSGGVYGDFDKTFYYPDRQMTIVSEGNPSYIKSTRGEMELDYNRLLDNRNSFLSTILRFSHDYRPRNTLYNTVSKDMQLFFVDSIANKSKTNNIVLDLYFDKRFNNNSNLVINLTGTSIKTDYSRYYGKKYAKSDFPDYMNKYYVDGKHRSLIAEMFYKYTFGNNYSILVGTNSSYSATDNQYMTNEQDITSISMNLINSYNYLSLNGRWKKISFALGGGLSYYHLKNGEQTNTFVFIRPSASLRIPITNQIHMQYQLGINPQTPTLSMLSQFTQQISEYEVSVGNARLKPYQSYQNQLTMSYNRKNTYLSFTAYLQYNHHPFTSNPIYYNADLDAFVYSLDNQNNFIHGQLKIYGSQTFFNNSLRISAYMALNRYINNGLTFHTQYTGLLGGGTVSYDHSHWGFQVNYLSPISTMFNQTKTTNSENLQIAGYYNIKKVRITLSINNPFINKAYSTVQIQGKALHSYSKTYYKYNNNMILLSLSYNLNIGKSKNMHKQTSNSDTDSGIIR